MENQCAEKVYVAINGADQNEAFGTLEWTLKRWSSHSITIVILHLHAASNKRKDYVYTPFGKVPASYVSREKLQLLQKCEDEQTEKVLSRYTAFCGKVKAEAIKIENQDQEPLQKQLVKLISGLRITKLVMAFTLMKSSSGKSNALSTSSSFNYVHQQKPDFCELFIVCGGRQVFLREENNEGLIEDEQGALVAKFKEKRSSSIRGWLGKIMFQEAAAAAEQTPHGSPSSSSYDNSPDFWEKHSKEIEDYYDQLNAEEEGDVGVPNSSNLQEIPTASDHVPANIGTAERIKSLKIRIHDAQEAIKLNRNEAKASLERHAKAEWAISLCTKRADELQACINGETAKKDALEKDLHSTRNRLYELQNEVEEKRAKLNSVMEIQTELSNKLQLSSLAKSRCEIQLDKAARTRAEMVREIEDLRRQRDVLQRRIEFCREKDAIGKATCRLSDLRFGYGEFTAAEIRAATEDFSERLRFKSAGDWTTVYKGRINHTTVAIKLIDPVNDLPEEDFHVKVRLLRQIRHPHLLAMIGHCSELKCIVYEYMHNGCLRDTLFSSRRSTRRKNQGLSWHARIRIAAEISTCLSFLHRAQPEPIIHGSLDPSKILLDRNDVAKVYGFKGNGDMKTDIRAFGNLVLQLLTGRNWAGLAEGVIMVDGTALFAVLDQMAGEWPLDMAEELGHIATMCLSNDENLTEELHMAEITEYINKLRAKADDLVTKRQGKAAFEGELVMEDSANVPAVFVCPIYQDIMKNPHVAADGFSYELEAIEEWLRTGHDTSPMTNLRLKHKLLTPNHTLRSLIRDWYNKRSVLPT